MKSFSIILAILATVLTTQQCTATETYLHSRPSSSTQQRRRLRLHQAKLRDGTPCQEATTCNQCIHESSFWALAGQRRCGVEPAPALVDGTPCVPYSSCQQCQHGYGAGDDNVFRCGVVTTTTTSDY